MLKTSTVVVVRKTAGVIEPQVPHPAPKEKSGCKQVESSKVGKTPQAFRPCVWLVCGNGMRTLDVGLMLQNKQSHLWLPGFLIPIKVQLGLEENTLTHKPI